MKQKCLELVLYLMLKIIKMDSNDLRLSTFVINYLFLDSNNY